ncbi:MAG: hypothetical protein E7001_02510 [Coriobacteriaceae bacterium]|nr:hypothetical protein [Coriobacteriaceae bacterium]
MSSNRKLLKILSLVQVPAAVALVVVAIMTMMGSIEIPVGAQVLGARLDDPVARYVIGAGELVAGVLTMASAVFGIRGANRPSALGSHRIVSAIASLLGLCLVIVGVSSAISALLLGALALALGVAAFVYDGRVRGELDW